MAHYDVFRQELATKYSAYGHALWEPSPGSLFPPVEIGDVGFIRRGKFHRLFNALLPADHPSHQNFGVPEHHEPLQLNMSHHIDTGTLPPNNFRSVGVTVVSSGGGVFASGPEPDHVSFSCSKKTGAILSLPVPARRQDTLAQGDFGRWIVKHIDLWFAYTRRLGLGITRMEDILLVTGCHLARSWANLAFLEGSGDEQVSFGVQVIGGSNVDWQFLPEEIQGVSSNLGPSGPNLPEDQCIFVRGFRATRLLGILPRLRGAARPTQSQNEDENKDNTYLINMPADNKSQDPLYVLLEYIATQRLDCDVALVHDDDLRCIVDRSPETLQPDGLIVHLRTSTPQIWRIQCDSSEAQTPATKVATLTMYSLGSSKVQEKPEPSVKGQDHYEDDEVSTVTKQLKGMVLHRDANGWTPLHSASSEGRVEVTRALLERGADATVQDNTGSTPLHWASCMGHVEVTRTLLKGGADVTAQDSSGSTPLHWASSRGHVEVVRTLVEGSADVTARNKKGWTPLHSASSEGRVEVTRALLEDGADATAQDDRGLTPLYLATSEGHVEVVCALLGL